MPPEPDWLTAARREGRVREGRTTAEGLARVDGAPDRQSEKDFMAEVIALAKSCGWKVYHTHNSRKSESGFPDLVLVREQVMVAELKVGNNRLTAAQANWLDSFLEAGVAAFEWRPESMAEIVVALRRTEPPR